uniref:Uncharacterized protein n=1 Tax=Anguilla anguilla TaxID=7936 RepID=A0A0E9PDY3_ANGAN
MEPIYGATDSLFICIALRGLCPCPLPPPVRIPLRLSDAQLYTATHWK